MNRGEAADAILDSDTTAVQVTILFGYIRHMPSAVAVERGVSWPSAARLARYAGTTRGTVVRQRLALIDGGVLVDAGSAPGGTPHYRIDFDALARFNAKKAKRKTPTREARWGVVDYRTGVSDSRTGLSDDGTGVSDSRTGGCSIVGHEPSVLNPLKKPSAVSPAEPEPPASEPLWQSMGLPKPGKGTPASVLTRDVLDVWAYWQKVHSEYAAHHKGVGKPRTMARDDLKTIATALQWQPETTAQCPDGMTVKALLCHVVAYAYRAPDGSPGVDWWRRPDRGGSDLNPRTLLRLGRDPKLPRNAAYAVAWRLAGGGAVSKGTRTGGDASGGNTARQTAEALWGAWSNTLLGKRKCIELGVPEDRWQSFVRAVVVAGQPRDIAEMHAIDRKAARAAFLPLATEWLRSEQGGTRG